MFSTLVAAAAPPALVRRFLLDLGGSSCTSGLGEKVLALELHSWFVVTPCADKVGLGGGGTAGYARNDIAENITYITAFGVVGGGCDGSIEHCT